MVVTFTSRVNVMNENTLSEPKVSVSLCILLSVLYLFLNIVVFIFKKNMVCISIVNVKQKQI